MLTWNIIFYASSAIMLVAASCLLFVKQPMHGAVYLTTSLLALAVIFYLLGAPFMAALQLILYVGAIMVLFVFFIMLSPNHERFSIKLDRRVILPLILMVIMLIEAGIIIQPTIDISANHNIKMITAKAVGTTLFGDYKIAVEAISTLLLGALVAVIYLAANIKTIDSNTHSSKEMV